MSSAVTTHLTPGMASASDVSMEIIRAWCCVDRSNLACSIPSICKSPAYIASPLTVAGLSNRATLPPTALPSPTPCVTPERPSLINSAAYSTASRILVYPVQRHRFLDRLFTISSRLGFGLFCNRVAVFIIMPGMQNPHCVAPFSKNACWTGCKTEMSSPAFIPFAAGASPSMVMMSRPDARLASSKHDFVGLPFIITMQLPHSPLSHAFFAPVSRKSSRRTSSKV